ncbi:MAG: LCP family protein [Lachnospiraceae bacterium]|nr:LCP family protein [Lachnospiraceae bacterium]
MSRHKGTIRINKRKVNLLATLLCVILGLVILAAATFTVIRAIGHKNMTTAVAGTGEGPIEIGDTADPDNGDEPLEERVIIYKGVKYRPNEDIITILVMGIDNELVTDIGGRLREEDAGQYDGGQADALFLVLLNPHTNTVNIVGINRNTMTDVDVFDENGNYLGIYKEQICLQHGYGDGGIQSCERQVRCVSKLLKGIPINSYASLSMDAIPVLNDAIGGVTVDVLDDIIEPKFGVEFHQGDTVTLHGNDAYWYLKYRDVKVFDSASLRLQRQKQYITLFGAKAKQEIKSDIRVAGELYNLMQQYMTTDMDITSYTYLASESSDYSFNSDSIYTLKGETILNGKFEEFYADEEALEDLIIQLYYEPIE